MNSEIQLRPNFWMTTNCAQYLQIVLLLKRHVHMAQKSLVHTNILAQARITLICVAPRNEMDFPFSPRKEALNIVLNKLLSLTSGWLDFSQLQFVYPKEMCLEIRSLPTSTLEEMKMWVWMKLYFFIRPYHCGHGARPHNQLNNTDHGKHTGRSSKVFIFSTENVGHKKNDKFDKIFNKYFQNCRKILKLEILIILEFFC